MKNASEKSIEKYLYDEIKKRRGICVKLNPNQNVGILDRLCILPGEMFIVELKTLTGRLRPVQIAMIKRLTEMGHTVHILRTKSEIDSLLAAWPI
jgi:hypothetical protein